MVLPEEIEGRGEITPQLSRDQQSASSSQQSSRAGGRSTKTLAQQKVQFLASFFLKIYTIKDHTLDLDESFFVYPKAFDWPDIISKE